MFIHALPFALEDLFSIGFQSRPLYVGIQILGQQITKILSVFRCVVSSNTAGVPILKLRQCNKVHRVCSWMCHFDGMYLGSDVLDWDLEAVKLP